MPSKQRKRSELLALHAEARPLVPHELVSALGCRLEGLCAASGGDDGGARWTDDDTSQALEGCPSDDHLGLRFYREDPLPWIRRHARQREGKRPLFVDHEFPVHDAVRLQVDTHAPNNKGEKSIRCTPGIITSSNCRDFRTDPNRLRRIPHFVQRAQRTEEGHSRWRWVRGSAMADCSLFSSEQSVDVRNIVQGKVGNCGFCAGFASIAASFPDMLRNAFGEESHIALSDCGAVCVRLFPRGEPRYLLMDDYILCNNGSLPDEDDVGSGRQTSSPSMHSILPNDLWVRFLEKAFVKLQGSYASLDGHYKYNSLYRHPARALQLLTGAPVAMEVHYSCEDCGVVYDILARATQDRCARVAHCRKRVDGLIPNHGYSLLWVGEGAGGTRLACLRNPHGQGSYTGRFGFGRATEELRLALFGEGADPGGGVIIPECFTICKTTGRVVWQQEEGGDCHPAFSLRDNHDNGIFFMQFGKFVECFPKATLVGPICAVETNGTAVPRGGDPNVPDCVHIVKRERLSHVGEIFRA